MKKLYALVAATALAIGGISYAAAGGVAFQSNLTTPSDGDGSEWTHECAGLELPYTSTIATGSGADAYDKAWTVLNIGDDNKAWAPASLSGLGNGYCMMLGYNSSEKNDWLISPALHMEGGKEYIVSYGLSTKSDKENLSVYLSESLDPETIKTGDPVAIHLDFSLSNKIQSYQVPVTASRTGDYHLAFHAHSAANRWNIYVGDIKVMENIFAPAPVGSLTATPAQNPILEVTLSWTLPSTDVFGVEMGEDRIFEKLEIYRDEDERPIATLTDRSTTFTDNSEYGLISGKHTYRVIVYYSGAASPEAKTEPTAYVGPYGPLTIPADMAVTSDMVGAWVGAYGENHPSEGNTWTHLSSPDRWRYSSKSYSADDTYLFSPMAIIPEAGYYSIEVTANLGSSYDEVFVETYLADAQDMDANMTPVRIDWNLFKTVASTQKGMFYASAPGTYCIATRVHIPSESYSAMIHELRGIKIDRGRMIPATVSGLKATAASDESLEIIVSWTNPSQSTAGTDLTAGSWYAEVHRLNGTEYELLATLTDGESEYADNTIPAAGSYTYRVRTVAIGTEASLDDHPTAISTWAGPREVAVPYSVWLNHPDEATRYIWEGIDGNGDGKTWGFGYSDRMVCPQPAQDLSDRELPGYYSYQDYLLSPVFDLKPGYYEVTFQMYGRSASHGSYNYDMSMNVGLTPAGAFIAERPEIIGKTLVTNNLTSYSNKTVHFRVESAGKYQLVFAADEINYRTYSNSTELAIGKVDFAYKPVLPGVATDLSVEADSEGALSALLRWKNPVVSNIEGIEPDLTKAIITRDGQEVAIIDDGLVAGEMSEWEDDAVPSPGIHTYTVTVFTAEGSHSGAAPKIKSPWIGKGLEAPYAVAPGEYVDHAWEQHSPNMTTTQWGNSNCFDLTTSNGARYDKGSKDVDGYLITPKLEIAHTQGYKLTVEAWKTSMTDEEKANGYPVDILVGTEGTPDTWFKIGTVAVVNSTSSITAENAFYIKGDNTAATETSAYDEEEPSVPEPSVADGSAPESAVAIPTGTIRLAFHISKNYDNGIFMFHSFRLDKHGETTDITNVIHTDGITLGTSGLLFDGAATDVRIYDVAGQLVSYTAEADGTVGFENLKAGTYIVHMTLAGHPVTIKIAR